MKKVIFILFFLLSWVWSADPSAGVTYGATLIRDKEGDTLSIDSSTWALVTVEYEHYEAHNGNMYTIVALDGDLDTGDSLSISFFVPDTATEIHWVPSAFNSVAASVRLLEAPTIDTSTGTEVSIYNRNRRSSNETIIQHPNQLDTGIVTINTSISDSGTVLDPTYIGTNGTPVQAQSGATRGEAELILKTNTVYTLLLIGQADNGLAAIRMTWYEHNPK